MISLREHQYTFLIISCSVALRMRNVSGETFTENQNIHFMLNIYIYIYIFFFFRKSCLYEIMWKNIVEPYRPQITTWRMHIACWKLRLETHTQNIISTATMVARTRLSITS